MKSPKKRIYALLLVRKTLEYRVMFYQKGDKNDNPFDKGMIEGLNIAIEAINEELGYGMTLRRPKK